MYTNQNYQTRKEITSKQRNMQRQCRYLLDQKPRGFNGDTWDAKHLTTFMSRSNYSNWRGQQKHIQKSQNETHHKRSHSTQGSHFFKTTKDNKNESKIGFTPIFPLVSNAPVSPIRQQTINHFFNANAVPKKSTDENFLIGRSFKLVSNPEQKFRFEGNSVKFKQTDPLTMKNQENPYQKQSGFKTQRMNRLISCRHPHGLTGIDHPLQAQPKLYDAYSQKIRIREQPNSHNTFVLNRQWKTKQRSVPPVDEWKTRNTVTIRQFRNDNTHGYNILTNRYLQE